MALSGIDPLLVISFKNKGVMDFFGEKAGASFLDSVAEAVGLPIPIYLSEQLTGIYVDNESRGIDVTTRVESVADKGVDGQPATPEVSQQSADSQVTVNLFARRETGQSLPSSLRRDIQDQGQSIQQSQPPRPSGSIMLTALLALMDMIVDRLVTAEYSIHYLNGPTAIFGAKLHRFATHATPGTDLINIELTLSTAAKEKNPTPQKTVESVAKSANPVGL